MNAFMSGDWNSALAFLLDSAIKGGIVILFAAAISWMLRRGSAAARHSVWSAAVAAQLLIPIFGLLLPTWRVALVDRPAPVVGAATPELTNGTRNETSFGSAENGGLPIVAGEKPAMTNDVAPSSSQPGDTEAGISPLVVLTVLWLLGAFLVLARLAVGTAIVSRMAARGERVIDEKWLGTMHRLALSLGITRPLTLMRGDSVGVPVTWGIVYPVVFLPADADQWPEDRRRYVLVHEMAHVKRLDAFTQLVAQIAAAIFWFNPLVWLAASRMRREREHACDDYVLAHGTRPSEYASDLLELVRSMGNRGHKGAAPAFAALAMARRSEFEGRMLSILDPEAPRASLSRTKVAVSSIAAVAVIMPLAAFSPFNPSARAITLTAPGSVPAPIAKAETRQPAQAAANVTPASKPTAASVVKDGAAAVLSAFSGLAASPCDRLGTSGTSNSSHINEDGDSPATRSVQLLRRRPAYCFEAAMNGRMVFAADDHDVSDMSPEARLRIREHTPTSDREIIVTPSGSELRHAYYEIGKATAFDEDARRWFAAMLVTTIRESGIDAQRRIARISRSSGSQGVINEIGSIQSSGAKRNYYLAYLQSNLPITQDDLARLLRQARTDLGESSGDLRTVLQVAMARGITTAATRDAFIDAAMSIESDGDKTTVVQQMAMTADKPLLIELMRVANTIDSDGDKSRMLIATAARYLVANDTALRDAYFQVVERVESDGDRSRVLINAAAFAHADENITLSSIRATHAMDSDGDKANVLISIAGRRLIINQRIRDAFLTATNRIDSDSDRARVLSSIPGGV